jgi:flagellar hook-basal body complex protein FliE
MINGINSQNFTPAPLKVGFENAQNKIADATSGVDLTKSFGQFLTDAVSDMNKQRAYVGDLQQKFITGELPDVHRLMIEAEKASLATSLTIQIRNKVVEAYQEIMRIQI